MTKKRDDGLILLSHPSTGTTAKASSVLQNNTKVYGPAKALDCDDVLTSWNSEGSPNGKKESFLIIDFCGGGKHPNRRVKPSEMGLQFQAGFSAEEVTVYAKSQEEGGSGSQWLKVEEIEAEDDHELQSFPLSLENPTSALKVVFDETTDFYGRVIIYQIQVWGEELGE
mmetsp:Transcript_8470/g.20916  ORF Transcript_8470/g.20916 Transcript_8470/m.20916 type:complete len:169 (-) Transcript_8470:102-608(-)|eukprot:CAMPEP_0172394140 /NCGR_PEP_ID=MMETSP1061-20121228/13453_1 /TAXON_ID=37318 /ORGANISM="Pseudo-nitzschia pungens, Strain cf. pungens" /LENGTH=168 /DNA_ID=CAMNT_0013125423 /DNA_START=54 /DNA_END=560 /DNA_ORIENTATION=-